MISNTINTAPTCCFEEKKEDQAYTRGLLAEQANPARPGVYTGQATMSARPGYYASQAAGLPSPAATQVQDMWIFIEPKCLPPHQLPTVALSITLALWLRKAKRRSQSVVKEKKMKDQEKDEDDEIEIEDRYTLDHLSNKDKLILMKLILICSYHIFLLVFPLMLLGCVVCACRGQGV